MRDTGAGAGEDVGRVDLDPAYREAFSFLESETRVDVLLALAADLHESVPDDEHGLSFSTLRERVGVRDSGRFNYHLDRLTDTLVGRVDGRYRLTPAGMQAVGTLVAGAFAAGESREPTAVDVDCPTCGGTMRAEYEAGRVTLACEEDPEHAVSNFVPPGATEGRTTEELVDVMGAVSFHELALSVQGVCPLCRGSFAWAAHLDDDTDGITYVGRCDRCAGVYASFPGMLAVTDTAVVSFLHDRGVDVRERHVWAVAGFEGDTEVVSRDPTRVAVTVTADDDRLRAVLDDRARVVEAETVA